MQVNELKERVQSIENGKNSAFEKQIEYFEHQRQEYNKKIERLQTELIEKEKQVAQQQNKLDRTQEEHARKLADFDFQVETLIGEKEQLGDHLHNVKDSQEERSAALMDAKL